MVKVQRCGRMIADYGKAGNTQHVKKMNKDYASGNVPELTPGGAGIGNNKTGKQREKLNAIAGIAHPQAVGAINTDGTHAFCSQAAYQLIAEELQQQRAEVNNIINN